jgi:hypothetical protein
VKLADGSSACEVERAIVARTPHSLTFVA